MQHFIQNLQHIPAVVQYQTAVVLHLYEHAPQFHVYLALKKYLSEQTLGVFK